MIASFFSFGCNLSRDLEPSYNCTSYGTAKKVRRRGSLDRRDVYVASVFCEEAIHFLLTDGFFRLSRWWFDVFLRVVSQLTILPGNSTKDMRRSPFLEILAAFLCFLTCEASIDGQYQLQKLRLKFGKASRITNINTKKDVYPLLIVDDPAYNDGLHFKLHWKVCNICQGDLTILNAATGAARVRVTDISSRVNCRAVSMQAYKIERAVRYILTGTRLVNFVSGNTIYFHGVRGTIFAKAYSGPLRE